MSTIILLIAIALALFLVEIILPGGILAFVGILCIIAASILAFKDYGPWMGMAVFTGGALLSALMLYLEIKVLCGSGWGKRWFQHKQVNEAQAGQEETASLVGKAGKVLTPMNPMGKVLIEESVYHAASLDGFLSKGTSIIVTKADPALIRVSAAE
jgi:membrane-bound serine protease (ClpP class)|tara:strand:+ start:2753 stop:3220 length:468 start_codon:yes stop_codon:yes gene_type:complete